MLIYKYTYKMLKSIIAKQYRQKVNQAASHIQGLTFPPEGWIATTRKALSMSAAALSRRLGKSRALVSNTEKAELHGGVTLKTMQNIAEAMHCRFVYAIIPDTMVEDIIEEQATKKAMQCVNESSNHMALEAQSLSDEHIAFEVERLKQELLRYIPADFWDDEVL